MALLPDTYSDKKIKVCIRTSRSFSVIAGAGSGKTTSLIKALDYVRITQGKNLCALGKRVSCITFTNRAVDVIKSRLNSDELFHISTLHGFLWGEVKKFNSNIRDVLIHEIIPSHIEKKKGGDNGGTSKAAVSARKKIAALQEDLKNVASVPEFFYDESGSRNYSSGKLDHDDIIAVSAVMIKKFPVLRKIIGQRYPYIFIDEAQDTFPEIVEALNLIASEPNLAIVGYFGDPMQQIYENRAGNFKGPEGAAIITKKENYRCSIEVIKLLNSFRADLQQVPSVKNVAGTVHVCLIPAEEGQGYRKAYTEAQLDRALSKFDAAIEFFGWKDDSTVKRLFLARQMIARRLGFPNLNQLFTGKYASRSAQDDYENGKHYLLVPFIKVLVPIVESYKGGNQSQVFNVLRQHSPLLRPGGESQSSSIKDVVSKAQKAIEQIVQIWGTANTKTILEYAIASRLVEPSDRLIEQVLRPKRVEDYDEDTFAIEKGDWLADDFFMMSPAELQFYIKFIRDETPFSTQHGVKGEEYNKVLVFYDDTEANWHNYSFSKLFSPVASGKEPTEGQKIRSQKLAYVCFSRAESDLRIILFTKNPTQAKTELVDQGLFRQEQITIQG
jgi:DNA helicase II / ATP-dependent DNA helicase PcrA